MTARARRQAITRWRRERSTAVASVASVLAFVLGLLAIGRWAERGLPLGIVVIGLVVGGLNGMVTIGLVLVYRVGKYINFAQGSIGAAGALVAGNLLAVNRLNFFLAVLVGLATSVMLAFVAEVTVVKRLFRAPRLILSVATIGLAQLFGTAELIAGSIWTDPLRPLPRIDVPISARFAVGSIVFHGDHVAALVTFPVVALALAALFRSTDFGAAIQASAENADQARLLGISVRRVSTQVWMLAGLLAGITAIIQVSIAGYAGSGTAGSGLLLRALAPAMIAGMSSLPVAVVAALGLGIVEQAIRWNTNSSGPVDAVLLAVILIALLVRRRQVARTTEGEERSFSAAGAIHPFPRQLAAVSLVRIARLAVRLVLLAVVVAVPMLLTVSQRNLASLVIVYAVAALSLTVLTGYAGQVSFGQWAFVGFGALFSGHLMTVRGVEPVTATFVTCAFGAMLAAVIGLPALRIRGLFLGVATLAFAAAASSYFFSWSFFALDGRVERPVLFGIDFASELSFYFLCLGVLLACMWIVHNLRSSRWGRNFLAVRDNDRAASSYGVGVVSSKLAAFAVSGWLASLAGVLYVFNQATARPSAFPVSSSLQLFSAVVIGGLGTVSGALIGALYLRGIQFFAPQLQILSTGLGLLIVLIAFPTGLGGVIYHLRDVLLRRLANRWHIEVPGQAGERDIDADADPRVAPPTDHLPAPKPELEREEAIQ